MRSSERLAAMHRERRELLTFLDRMDDDHWTAPSLAPGWRVRDAVAHLGATSRQLLGTGVLDVLRSNDAERLNDRQVALRADWPVKKVLRELAIWSRRAVAAVELTSRPPLGPLHVRIAELGRYPLRLTPSLLVFDWHVHLREDIAPAIGLSPPATDPERLGAVLEWMLAGMEQMNRHAMGWVDRPIAITLTGPAGNTWRIEPAGGGLLRVRPGPASGTVTHITATSQGFPGWATTRTSWREADTSITGDQEYATRFLDALNIV